MTLTSLALDLGEDFSLVEPNVELEEEWLDWICSPARGTTIWGLEISLSYKKIYWHYNPLEMWIIFYTPLFCKGISQSSSETGSRSDLKIQIFVTQRYWKSHHIFMLSESKASQVQQNVSKPWWNTEGTCLPWGHSVQRATHHWSDREAAPRHLSIHHVVDE